MQKIAETEQNAVHKRQIVKILLSGSIFLSALSSSIYYGTYILSHNSETVPPFIGLVFIFFFFLWLINKKGYLNLTSYLLILSYWLISIFLFFQWGIDLPQSLLILCLVILLSGILVNNKFAFLITVLSCFGLIIFGFLQNHHLIHTYRSWRTQEIISGDANVFSATFLIIFTVAWLFNREIERSLMKAAFSEAELKKERDLLEVRVQERTAELQKSQYERLMEAHRFADFGRHTAGLLHDLVTPLTSQIINLETLDKQSEKIEQAELKEINQSAKRALEATKRMERFVRSVRQQIQPGNTFGVFSAEQEINQVIEMLKHRARKQQVTIQCEITENLLLAGNPIKFYKVILNLLSNAIDAYEPTSLPSDKRKVRLSLKSTPENIILIVEDWGTGIKAETIPHIFETLFTTKPADKGTGLGLTICKEIIESEWLGSIQVKSQLSQGSCFTIALPLSMLAR